MATVRELLTRWGFSIDERPLTALERSIDDVKRAVTLVGTAVTAAAAGIFGLAEATREHIDDIDELSQSVGMSAQFFAELSAAAQLSGASMDDVATATGKLQQSIANAKDGNAEAIKSFGALGISAQDLRTLPTEAILTKMADGFKGTADPAKRVAMAMELLGRGGRKMLPTFMGGAAGLAELGDEARRFGLVPGPEAIKAANEMERGMARAKGVVAGLGLQIGTALMPVVTDVAQRFSEWAMKNREVIASKISGFVKGLTVVVRLAWKAVSTFASALTGAVSWLQRTGFALVVAKGALVAFLAVMAVHQVAQFALALKGVVLVVKALALACQAHPMITLMTLMTILIAEVVANWDDLAEAFGMAADAFMAAWEPIADWLQKHIVEPLRVVLDPIHNLVGVSDVERERDRLAAEEGRPVSHSPGRPGSPESSLTPDPSSSGLLYNPALAAAMGEGRLTTADLLGRPAPSAGAGSRSLTFTMGDVHVSVPEGTNAEGIAQSVRRAVRSEWDAIAREAALDVG